MCRRSTTLKSPNSLGKKHLLLDERLAFAVVVVGSGRGSEVDL